MTSSLRAGYFFLSNFCPIQFEYKGETYYSVEHAYQAAKCVNPKVAEKIRNIDTAGKARKIGSKISLKPNWDSEKKSVMDSLLRIKFNNVKFRELLRKTGSRKLIEANMWHDTYWGVCNCKRHNGFGENVLGELLMQIRSDIWNTYQYSSLESLI